MSYTLEINKPQCSNCKFWMRHEDGELPLGAGWCRRFPPSGAADGDFPTMSEIGWCGEFKLKMEEEV